MRRIPIFLMLAFLAVSTIGAEALSLDDAVEEAKANNISLEIARMQLKQNLRNASTISSWLPDFTLNGSITTSASAIDRSWSSPMSATMNIGVSYSIGTSDIGTAEKARINETIANLSYAMNAASLEESVTIAYINLQGMIISIESSRLNCSSLQRSLDSTKEKYESGQASELDLYEAELALREAEYNLKALQDSYDISLDSFRTLTGISDDEIELVTIEYAEELSLPSAEELIAKHSSSILSLQSADASVRKAENSLKSTKISSYYPSVSFSAGWDLTGSANVSSSWNAGTSASDNFYGRLTVSVPISSYIPGSSGNNSIKNAEDDVEIAKLEVANQRQAAISEIRGDIATIRQQDENIALAEQRSEIANKTLELRKEAYDAGISSLSDLLTAENNVLSAQLSLDSARITQLLSVYNLCFDLGITREELEAEYSI